MKKFHPKRKCTKERDQEIWVYEDPNDQALAIKGAIFQFNLVDFDTWLMKLETCAAKDQLIERRQAAVDAKKYFSFTAPSGVYELAVVFSR